MIQDNAIVHQRHHLVNNPDLAAQHLTFKLLWEIIEHLYSDIITYHTCTVTILNTAIYLQSHTSCHTFSPPYISHSCISLFTRIHQLCKNSEHPTKCSPAHDSSSTLSHSPHQDACTQPETSNPSYFGVCSSSSTAVPDAPIEFTIFDMPERVIVCRSTSSSSNGTGLNFLDCINLISCLST